MSKVAAESPTGEIADEGKADGSKGQLSRADKLAYGLPQVGLTSASFLISVYGTRYYSLLGAKLSFIAFFTALARSFDVMTDPLMGWYSDKTRTKWGRRRPFMATGAPFYALLLVLLFAPPKGLDSSAISYWFGFFYVFFFLFDTYANVPYQALGPELTSDYEERNSLYLYAKFFNFFGVLMGGGGPAMIKWALRKANEEKEITCGDAFAGWNETEPVLADGNARCYTSNGDYCYEDGSQSPVTYNEAPMDTILKQCYSDNKVKESGVLTLTAYALETEEAMRISFLVVCGGFALWYLTSMLYATHRLQENPNAMDQTPVELVPSILRSLKNQAFRPLLMGWVLDAVALAALVAMFPFFVEYIVKPDGVVARENNEKRNCVVGIFMANQCSMSVDKCLGLCIFALLGAACCSMPAWKYAAQRFGKYPTWIAYNIFNACTNILFVIPGEGDPWYTIFISFINGLPVGGQFLIDSILADTIDYDEFLNGSRSEGGFSVFATFIPKFVSIPASALPFAIINAMGFVAPVQGVAQEQKDDVKGFIRAVFVFMPFVCVICSVVIKSRFPIRTKKISQTITDGIAKHKKGEKALDPLTEREVGLMNLNPEEEEQMWIFENFSTAQLSAFMLDTSTDDGKKQRLPGIMLTQVIAASSLAVTFLALTIAFWASMENESDPLSLIPVLGIIFAGFSITCVGFCYLRYKSALNLCNRSQQDYFKMENLILQLLEHKECGQRAGDYVPEDQRASVQIKQRGDSEIGGSRAQSRLNDVEEVDKDGADKEDVLTATTDVDSGEVPS